MGARPHRRTSTTTAATSVLTRVTTSWCESRRVATQVGAEMQNHSSFGPQTRVLPFSGQTKGRIALPSNSTDSRGTILHCPSRRVGASIQPTGRSSLRLVQRRCTRPLVLGLRTSAERNTVDRLNLHSTDTADPFGNARTYCSAVALSYCAASDAWRKTAPTKQRDDTSDPKVKE